ncbi:MAG TPA: Ig-like domain-containing protein [Candidatus Eisenbacteria bacterium]|nr:Ig-like domain-containing protein [Candidatus Eisenbacteria bacterium]
MRNRILLAAAVIVTGGGLGGCARSIFPPGGPIDIIAPRVVATAPADSAARVAIDSPVEITFSEAMDRASVRDGFRIYPPVGRQTFDWSGRTVRVVWDRPLSERTTYTVLLSGTIRDARSVPMRIAVTVRFSTGDSLDRGRISGVLRAKTLRRTGVPILAFPDSLGPRPDTMAVNPIYATETDTGGVYSLGGLPANRGFTVHAFYDLNSNGSIDPEADLIVSYPTPIRLTPERMEADSINIVAVDPKAPAILSGKIVTPDSTARFRVEAVETSDSTLFRRVERVGPGAFAIRVPAGTYRLSATRLPVADEEPGPTMRRAEPVEAKPEEEYGPFEFDFSSVPARERPAPPPE